MSLTLKEALQTLIATFEKGVEESEAIGLQSLQELFRHCITDTEAGNLDRVQVHVFFALGATKIVASKASLGDFDKVIAVINQAGTILNTIVEAHNQMGAAVMQAKAKLAI